MMPECRQIDERLLDFVYGELPDEAQAEVRAHLAGCDRCTAEIESLQKTRTALRELPEEDPPAALTARLVHEASRPRTLGAKLHGLLGVFVVHPAWSLGAATAVVLILSMVVFREQQNDVGLPAHEQVPRRDEVLAKEEPRAAVEPAAAPAAPAIAASPKPVAPPAEERGRAALAERKSAARYVVGKREAPAKPSGRMKSSTADRDDALDELLSGASGSRGAGAAAPAAEAPAYGALSAPTSADLLRREGDRRRAQGDCPGAIKSYQRLLDQYPMYGERLAVRRALEGCLTKTTKTRAAKPAADDAP